MARTSNDGLRRLVIVESPAKVKTIAGYLGTGYVVESSFGHIRDLPTKKTEVPVAKRDRFGAPVGVDVEGGFEPLYVVPPGRPRDQVRKLKAALKGADELLGCDDAAQPAVGVDRHQRPEAPQRPVGQQAVERRVVAQHPVGIEAHLLRAARPQQHLALELGGAGVPPDLGLVQLRPAQRRQRAVQGVDDGGKGIDEGAVHIEQDGADHAASLPISASMAWRSASVTGAPSAQKTGTTIERIMCCTMWALSSVVSYAARPEEVAK